MAAVHHELSDEEPVSPQSLLANEVRFKRLAEGRDRGWGLLFLFTFLATFGFTELHNAHIDSHERTHYTAVYAVIAMSLALSLGILAAWTALAEHPKVLHLTIVSSVVCGVILAAVSLSRERVLFGALLVVLTSVYSLWILWIRTSRFNDVHFICSLLEALKTALTVSEFTKTVVVITAMNSFLVLVFVAVILPATNAAQQIALVLVTLWAFEILKNILHVLISLATLRWYFAVQSSQDMPHPISFLYHKFGSICKGSMFLFPFRILSIFSFFRKLRCFRCLKTNTFEHYDVFAWPYLILYGQDYSTACRECWSSFEIQGMHSLVSDSLLPSICTLANFGSASLLCLVSFGESDKIVALSFYIGFICTSLTLESLIAVKAALLVGFSEQPSRMFDLLPLVFHRWVRISEFGYFDGTADEPSAQFALGVEVNSEF